MTWKELIVYILENDLEDLPISEDGKLNGLLTLADIAVMYDVGIETAKVWGDTGLIKGIKIGDTMYFVDTTRYLPILKGDNNA